MKLTHPCAEAKKMS